MEKFIYVLNHNSYKEYLDKGLYRFVPNKLLIRFESKIKPRIVCHFIGKNDEDIRGYGVGVSLLQLCKNKDKFIERLIDGLNELQIEGTDRIIFDDILGLNDNDINKIQEASNKKIANGRKTLLEANLQIIKEICRRSNKDIRNQEFLIISDSGEDTRKLALEIAKEVNYLTIQGLDESCVEEVANEILIETGLAIHNTYDINNRIHKYNFILNLSANPNISINKIKKKAIVLDFGVGRRLSCDIRGLRKDIMVVDDCIFCNTNKLLCDNGEKYLGKDLPSHIYEGVAMSINKKDLIKIKNYSRTYTIKQACDLFLNVNSNKIKFKAN